MTPAFMFATGIENSNPIVGRRRVDQMELCRHYEKWQTDFDKVEELGLSFLRYGLPLHRVAICFEKSPMPAPTIRMCCVLTVSSFPRKVRQLQE